MLRGTAKTYQPIIREIYFGEHLRWHRRITRLLGEFIFAEPTDATGFYTVQARELFHRVARFVDDEIDDRYITRVLRNLDCVAEE